MPRSGRQPTTVVPLSPGGPAVSDTALGPGAPRIARPTPPIRNSLDSPLTPLAPAPSDSSSDHRPGMLPLALCEDFTPPTVTRHCYATTCKLARRLHFPRSNISENRPLCIEFA